MNKIGVNDECPCKSGLKFKRCCRLRGVLYEEDFSYFTQKLIETRDQLKDFNAYNGLLVGTPIIQTKLRNMRGVLVGNSFYIRDYRETFQDFLVHQLKHGLGWLWGTKEVQKTLNQRHVYLRWLNSFASLVREKTTQDNKLMKDLYSTEMNGDSQMLLSFAYDIFTLRNADQLPSKKIKELREWNKFQSTRYEIAIAAIFIRAGFTLEWYDDKTTSNQHGEFIATHLKTREKIDVEVKSKYRDGTYHVKGELTLDQIKTGVKSKLKDAYKQLSNNSASMIFVDLNLPMDKLNQDFSKGIPNELMHSFDGFEESSEKCPSQCNAVIFTNWSWHYFGKGDIDPSISTINTFPVHVKFPISQNIINLINTAINQYSQIPYPVFD